VDEVPQQRLLLLWDVIARHQLAHDSLRSSTTLASAGQQSARRHRHLVVERPQHAAARVEPW
jgi:hypothetical protein